MITFQEYEQAADKQKLLVEAMDNHIVDTAVMLENERYYYGENPFLDKLKNTLNLKGSDGESVPIVLEPAEKVTSGFFAIIVGHIVGRLWDNPVQIGGLQKGTTIDVDETFGENFISDVHQIATYSAIHKVCYAFFNHGKVEMFRATEYLPFSDERTGAHKAGLRFWRVADKKPWVVQFYHMNGYTEYSRQDGKDELVFVGEFPYKRQVPVGGRGFVETTPIMAGEPYPDYPIVPLYTNPARISELTAPIKSKINMYDAKETTYMDEALKAKFLLWVFKGFGGDPTKLKSMLTVLQGLGIIAGGDVDETSIESKVVEVPHLSHEATLDRIESAIYRDARIMNPAILISGGVTATAIEAAGMDENNKMVGVESEGRKFIRRLLDIAGVEYGHITFTHKTIDNGLEKVQMLSQGVGDLPFRYRVMFNPAIPQELREEIVAFVEADELGMSDNAIAEFEAMIKRLMDGQGEQQQTEGTGQETAPNV
jgi:hypothetical protein